MNLIYQINTDLDSGEVFGYPLGVTDTDGVVFINNFVFGGGFTLKAAEKDGNSESVGNFSYMAEMEDEEANTNIKLYVVRVLNLDKE